MSICSLADFPPVTPDGYIALCEMEGRIHTMPIEVANISTFTHATAKYPVISVTQELFHPAVSGLDMRQVFLPVEEPLLKRVFNVWSSNGMFAALQLIAEEAEEGNAHPILSMGVAYIMSSLRYFSKLFTVFDPLHRVRIDALISSVSQTRHWLCSRIRCMAWHPHCTKIAVALIDDSIHIYSSDSTLTPVLKSKGHRAVSCMAWRPLSGSELAVGYGDGILVWYIDPTSVVTRLSPSCATVLRRSNHSPVTSLSWSTNGDLLLSASATDTSIYVWDIDMETSTPMYKITGGGVVLASWSPDSNRVLAASSNVVLRIWETGSSSSHKLTVAGRVQAACWSPCSSVALFTTTEDTLVYSLLFQPLDAFKSKSDVVAIPVIDITQIELSNGERVGGPAKSMIWDDKGVYLAILFQDTDFVAVFRTYIQTTLQVSPCVLLSGLPDEFPTAISFQPNFTEGSLLTIAWSSGRIQYFPFIFSNLGNEYITYPEPHYRSINSPISNLSQIMDFRTM